MEASNISSFGRGIARLVMEGSAELLCLDTLSQAGIGLVAISPDRFFELSNFIEEFVPNGDMRAKVLGILGMSYSGRALARRAYSSSGMQILYHSPERVAEIETRCNARCCPVEDILEQASLVCIALPLDATTEELIGTGEFALRRSQPVLLAWDRSAPIEQAVTYLCERYADQIHVSDLAAMTGLSECYFVHLFSTRLGISPHRFQLLTRVIHAKAMLRGGGEIGDVALQLGFSDQSHLNRHFRSVVGVTPGQYRRTFTKCNSFMTRRTGEAASVGFKR